MNVELIMKHAESMLDLALENNNFEKFILGNPMWSVKIKNADGSYEDAIYAKMEAIYKYYREKPNSGIDKNLYMILNKYTAIIKGDEALLTIFKTIEYQIVAEAEKRAPFVMENANLLNNLKNNLMSNQELYRSQLYEQKGFWSTIEQHNETLASNYGHKVL
jgi:hypothetical protein